MKVTGAALKGLAQRKKPASELPAGQGPLRARCYPSGQGCPEVIRRTREGHSKGACCLAGRHENSTQDAESAAPEETQADGIGG